MENRASQYRKFNHMVADLLLFADRTGIPIKGGEWYRTQAAAAVNAASGVGSINSKHIYSLAIDLVITTPDGLGIVMLNDPRYRQLGDFWESQGGRWGGNFKTSAYSDIYHFELNELPYKNAKS